MIDGGEVAEVGAATAAPAVADDSWRRLRWAAYAAYLAVLVGMVIHDGVPTETNVLAIIIISGLTLSSIGRGWRRTAQVIVDWLPFTAVLLFYDHTRSVVDSLGVGLHEGDVLGAEKWLFGGAEPTLWLQQQLYDAAHIHWYDALVTLVYTSHFLATPVLAAVLWLRDRALWLRYISRVIVLAVAGLLTYCIFPEAPPWMAAQDGLTAPVARLSSRGWVWLHMESLDDVIAKAQYKGANPIAAMPSLHLAFAVLVAVTIGGMIASRWRLLLALYPVAMGFTLVYTGEHYVLDLLAGASYALAVHGAMKRWERRRGAQAAAEPPPVPEAREPARVLG